MMELYPIVKANKRKNITEKIVISASILAAIICLVINICVDFSVKWSYIVIVSIVYSTIVAIYALRKNTNIGAYAAHQMVELSMLNVLIDVCTGYHEWAVNYVIPSIFLAADLVMLTLMIIHHKNYMRYSVIHIIIFLLHVFPMFIYLLGLGGNMIMLIILNGVAVLCFIMPYVFCIRDMSDAIKKILNV